MAGWTATMILVPETFGPVLLVKKAKRLRAEDPVANKDRYAAHEKTDWSFKGVVQRVSILNSDVCLVIKS